MTDSLDALRPEVREAVDAFDIGARVGMTFGNKTWNTIRAELLRLAKAEFDLMLALQDRLGVQDEYAVVAKGWQERAEKAEAELAALKARIDGSRHAFLGPNMDRITFLAEDIGPIGKYALVKVEE